jgi:hypothetical protein
VNRTLLWLIVAAALLIAVVLYICCGRGTHLNVDPHSREVIEKAQRR